MLSAYASAGFDPLVFWELSPRIYLAHMRGARMRQEEEHRGRAWLAWHAAYLGRSKKPVKLESLLPDKPKTPLSWEQQLAAWMAYAKRKNQ